MNSKFVGTFNEEKYNIKINFDIDLTVATRHGKTKFATVKLYH